MADSRNSRKEVLDSDMLKFKKEMASKVSRDRRVDCFVDTSKHKVDIHSVNRDFRVLQWLKSAQMEKSDKEILKNDLICCLKWPIAWSIGDFYFGYWLVCFYLYMCSDSRTLFSYDPSDIVSVHSHSLQTPFPRLSSLNPFHFFFTLHVLVNSHCKVFDNLVHLLFLIISHFLTSY